MAALSERLDWVAARLQAGERAIVTDVALAPEFFTRADGRPLATRVGFARWPGKDLICTFIDEEIQPLCAADLPQGVLAAKPIDGGLRQVMVPYRGDLLALVTDVETVLGLRGRPRASWTAPPPASRTRSKTPLLDSLAIDLTAQARQGTITLPIARDAVIDRVCRTLRGRFKNNPCLVSEPGVGKTKLIEGVAVRIHQGVAGLEGCRVLLIEAPRITAKAAADGRRVEELVLGLADEAAANRESEILACDELHQLLSVQGSGGLDAGEMLKPYLGRGRFRLIGACTHDEYRRHIQQDAAFERRFLPVPLEEPSIADAIRMVGGVVPQLEAHHRITIAAACVEAAVRLSHRLIRDRFLPDKAIDLLDQAAARMAPLTAAKADGSKDLVPGAVHPPDGVTLEQRIADPIDRGDYKHALALTDAGPGGAFEKADRNGTARS
jgi:hypothetical protein